VEIAYFGVLPQFTGQGIGSYLLSQAVHRAWAMAPGIRRVWLHTCTKDHPGALRNYLARGFTVCKEEETDMELPAESPGPWPGAERPR
jgi:GNAT superfamily N-acetyltransferase